MKGTEDLLDTHKELLQGLDGPKIGGPSWIRKEGEGVREAIRRKLSSRGRGKTGKRESDP